jgi:hypothetical protein
MGLRKTMASMSFTRVRVTLTHQFMWWRYWKKYNWVKRNEL